MSASKRRKPVSSVTSSRRHISHTIVPMSIRIELWERLAKRKITDKDRHVRSGNPKFETLFDKNSRFVGLPCPVNAEWVFPVGYCTGCSIGLQGKCKALDEATLKYTKGKFDSKVWYQPRLKLVQVKNGNKVTKPKKVVELQKSGKAQVFDVSESELNDDAEYFQIEKIFEATIEFTTDSESESLALPEGKFLVDKHEKVLSREDILKDPISVNKSLLYMVGPKVTPTLKIKVKSRGKTSKTVEEKAPVTELAKEIVEAPVEKKTKKTKTTKAKSITENTAEKPKTVKKKKKKDVE